MAIILLTTISQHIYAQFYPTFGPEIKVSISGLTFDAMEPFISLDGNTLYFNSLNSGGNTNLYYATRLNDSTFTFIGLVGGCYDPSPNHLDAVASIDSLNNFFWTSLRSIPNLYKGIYQAGIVNNISKVYGTCNIVTPGWIIMDAAINYQGNLLYYSNGYFGPTFTECVGVPCEAKLGIAQKVNDSTFNKIVNSDAVFSNVNDTNYLVYAPQITKDGLELYYTRLLEDSFNTEICVSVRSSISDTFSLPIVIHSNFGRFPEAATPTSDKQKIYYHQKDENQLYRIYLRYRTSPASIKVQNRAEMIKVYPNPTQSFLNIDLPDPLVLFTVSICSILGEEIVYTHNKSSIDISHLTNGVYLITVIQNENVWKTKILKEEGKIY